MRPRIVWSALVLTLVFVGSAGAQYAPVPIILDGDAVVGLPGLVDNVGRPNFGSGGSYVVEGDGDNATIDEFIIVDGDLLLVEGMAISGSGGTLALVNLFDTWRHRNAAGDVAWAGTVTGPPTTGDGVLCRNDVKLIQEGEASPIAGRLFGLFNSINITDGGDIYFEADLDGATTDDEVLMVWTAGGTTPLSMNIASIFREGALIVGGPLDARTWDTVPFSDMRVNSIGTVVVEGNLDEVGGVTTADDDVIIRKQVGLDYELLLRAGDLVATPLTASVPFEFSNEITLAGNGDWVIRAEVTTGATTNDSVVIASLGGAAPAAIAQESTDISALTGVAGTTIGTINGVSINSSGQVLFLADILPTTAPWDEGLFLVDGGVLTLVMTDEIAVPSIGGANLTGITVDNIKIDDAGRYFFEGDLSTGVTLDGVFEALIPPVFSVSGLACAQVPATTTVGASWTNSVVTPYDGIRVYLDTVLQTTLAGTATSYTTGPLAVNVLHTIELEPFIGADEVSASCSVFVVEPRDAVECRVPVPPPAIDSLLPPVIDVFSVATNLAILDLTLFLDITHTFQGDIDILIASPAGTSVMLTNNNGGGADNFLVTFADWGIPIGAGGVTLNSGQFVQPIGPGAMADFGCELSGGDWTLTVDDNVGGDVGTLDEWCLNIYEEPAAALNCCPGPGDLSCSDLGACGGPGVVLAWTNNFAYSLLQLTRTDSVGPPLTIPLAAAATSFQDLTAAVGTSYTYTLEYRCTAGGQIQDAADCSATPTSSFVPPVTDLVCSPDFCSDQVSLTWSTNGVPYTAVTLNRSGVFLANVTGLSSFVDNSPVAGPSTYSLIAACGISTAATNCVVNNALLGPSGLTCAVDPILCNGSVSMTWTNNGTYQTIDLLIDGIAPAIEPGPADTSFVTTPLSSGPHTLELTATCAAGSAPPVSCNVSVSIPPAGESDCILALEGRESADDPGLVDSVSSLATALLANGRTVYITAPPTAANPDFTTQLPCGVDLTQFETIWVMTGTYPDDYRISAAEGDLLASLNRDNNIGIYFEASDHWYFTHTVSQLDNRDGVWTGGVDGDDTFTSMSGQSSGNGLDPTAAFATPVNYSQDQTGTDFTDRMTISTVGQDPDIASAGGVWLNNNDGLPLATDPDEALPYVTTVYAVNTLGAAMISSSWELGGFALDPLDPPASDASRATLVGLYLAALGRSSGPTNPQIVRGDANDDAGVNIADAIFLLGNLFPGPGGPNPLDCLDAADANDDGFINIADAISLLGSLFGIPTTPLPFPNITDGCGEDPGQELGCVNMDSCP